ncbi:cystatin-like [Hemibagrus wyckioides]|uniref:cystatin-like n=1 Tax=Hemibagrus wyckioides TaxID=337641 RepID=UPI00266CFB6B|nr:cystatin-like [Hemibagrus wyckioides]
MFIKVVASLLAVCVAVTNSALVGAPMDADINSPEVQNALCFAIVQHNSGSDSSYISQVVNVIKAQMQIVSGIKYTFIVEMAITSCIKEEPEETCVVNSDPAIAQPHECKPVVWSQPWLMQSMTLTENTC